MTVLYAIGSDRRALSGAPAIDAEIVESAPSDTPRVLFVPTASGDADEAIAAFESRFGDRLGCEVDVLSVVGTAAIEAESAEKIGAADVIYVGDGDASFMLEVWRTRGIHDLLREAWQNGTVLAGHSAGAIGWFAGGLTEATSATDVDYAPVSGLQFIPTLHLTPRATPGRRAAFARYLSVRGARGIALEPDAAIEITDTRWRIHTRTENAFAFHFATTDEAVSVDILPADGDYRALAQLT